MARIRGAEASQQGAFGGLLTRIVYALTKRKLGRVVMPVQVTAHHPQILWGYGQMEQSLLSSRRVDTAPASYKSSNGRYPLRELRLLDSRPLEHCAPRVHASPPVWRGPVAAAILILAF